MVNEIKTLEDFEQACKAHDLTYDYSDDHSVWLRGCASMARIQAAGKLFPKEDVERIWNAVVDTKLIESVRKQFYWQWPRA